jgi:hypothetical protein
MDLKQKMFASNYSAGPYYLTSPQLKAAYENLLDSAETEYLTSFLSEKSEASQSLLPTPQPTGGPQKISRPLDPRKGGEIRLTEEEVQLATSPGPVEGPSKPSRGQSSKKAGSTMGLCPGVNCKICPKSGAVWSSEESHWVWPEKNPESLSAK